MTGSSAHAKKKILRSEIRTDRDARPLKHASRTALVSHVSALVHSITPARNVHVLGYASIGAEPSIDVALDEAREAGAHVYLPVVTRVGEPLMFGEVARPMHELDKKGSWGIREPEPSLTPHELVDRLDLALIPGLGFSARGDRLGNGGGFYDRTFGPQGVAPLHQLPVRTVGVCFDSEFGVEFDVHAWDFTVDGVVTETGLHVT